ncbi:hypothetical protein EYZ11_012745 [Aspergillus tanneri]|uniref:Uncharacterized protein n=1 Tax=Aspergillus tanneri TaxID=1220188 RepID=A0A4S3J1K5_9EURO|nr:hypothetical protein EYZ11_012745 [Aspergillus tanneri]
MWIINMAPPLAPSTREFIYGMIMSKELTASQMAEAAGCHKRTIERHRSNVQVFDSASGKLAGLPEAPHPPKLPNFIATSGIKFSLHMLRMGLFCLVFFKVQRTLLFLKTLLESYFSIAENGQSQNL